LLATEASARQLERWPEDAETTVEHICRLVERRVTAAV
jgi:hypothetical protein